MGDADVLVATPERLDRPASQLGHPRDPLRPAPRDREGRGRRRGGGLSHSPSFSLVHFGQGWLPCRDEGRYWAGAWAFGLERSPRAELSRPPMSSRSFLMVLSGTPGADDPAAPTSQWPTPGVGQAGSPTTLQLALPGGDAGTGAPTTRSPDGPRRKRARPETIVTIWNERRRGPQQAR
jgi:hypothetical protein